MTGYDEFLKKKQSVDCPTGIEPPNALSPHLFDFQVDIVKWALRRGRAAIWADCGMGKTAMQLEWAQHVPGNVLILAPLAVSHQTVKEGEKFGIPLKYVRNQDEVEGKISITNYEKLDHFDPSEFNAIVLDESSILKSYSGKIRNNIIESFLNTPFRLACTATPAPNDFMEIGNHSEFLGVMSRTEMLAMYFVHDGGDTAKWRLKGHAENPFWKWLCSWAVMIRKPSDLGYSDETFILPELTIQQHTVEVDQAQAGFLFPVEALTLQERQQERKGSVDNRVAMAAELVASRPNEPWLIWCNLNEESEKLTKAITGAVEVKGSDKDEHKEKSMLGFAAGTVPILVSKASICGFGMNFQQCHNMIFVGLSDSYEQFYQAVRRCWRFGQVNPVTAHVITAETEGAVVRNIQRKEADAMRMAEEMTQHMAHITRETIRGTERDKTVYKRNVEQSKNFTMHHGDCIEVIREISDESVHFSIFSPPFASLYTYSNSDRDMGNCKSDQEFADHFKFLVPELYRITMPGRLVAFHCMNLPTSKERDGVIGIRDFRGELIRVFADAGWIYHSEVCIWKDPVTAMQRTKALGLLHKTIRKDSAMSRQGIPDYLVVMRKPGVNPEPIARTHEEFPIPLWQRYASPIWMDINPSNTLQKASAREDKDERHICPLQLEVIERAINLWTNPGDTVFSPFGGIGSEGYVSLRKERKFIGVELKESYWKQAVANLKEADSNTSQQHHLFA